LTTTAPLFFHLANKAYLVWAKCRSWSCWWMSSMIGAKDQSAKCSALLMAREMMRSPLQV